MTLIAALTSSFNSVLIADSRLTWESSQTTHRDICQKVVRLGNEALVGFSGEVETAVRVLGFVTGTFEHRGLGWLTDESEFSHLMDVAGAFPNGPRVQIVATFVHPSHEVMPGIWGTIALKFDSQTRTLTKTYLGIVMAGSGSEILDDVLADPGLSGFLNFGGSNEVHRMMVFGSMFFAEVINGTAVNHHIDSVGGLFQIHYLLNSGVHAVPYERWVEIAPGYGTYVQMDMDAEGRWFQSHRETGLRIPIRFPVQDKFEHDSRSDLTFDLPRRLTPSSPGVVPAQNPQEIYRPIGEDWDIRIP